MTPNTHPDGSRDGLRAVARGALGRCPACGRGRLFGRFLKVVPACSACGTEFHHHRADDFPPYIVMFVVGHLLGYAIYVSEIRFGGLSTGVNVVLWPTLALTLSLGLLQPVKGAVVALQYALRMHGFAGGREGASEQDRPEAPDGATDAGRRAGAAPAREAQAREAQA